MSLHIESSSHHTALELHTSKSSKSKEKLSVSVKKTSSAHCEDSTHDASAEHKNSVTLSVSHEGTEHTATVSTSGTHTETHTGAHPETHTDTHPEHNEQPSSGSTHVLAPVIVSIQDDVGANQGAIKAGGSTDDRTPTLAGTGEPGTLVDIRDNGVLLGTATVGDDWQWTFTPSQPLTAGVEHQFTAIGHRADGSGATPSVYGYKVMVQNDDAGDHVLTPVIVAAQDNVGHEQHAVLSGGHTDDTTPTLTGTGDPGTVVDILDNGTLLGSATVGADWQWSYTPTKALALDSVHEFTVVGHRADGSGATNGVYGLTLNILDDSKSGSLDDVLCKAGLTASATVTTHCDDHSSAATTTTTVSLHSEVLHHDLVC